MTYPKLPNKQRGFADLRQQVADMACDTAITADEMGKLPDGKLLPTKRATLHLRDNEHKATTPAK